MANLERLRREIAEIGARRRSVSADEITRIIDRLGDGAYITSHRPTRHGRLYRIGEHFFSVCEHNPPGRFVKAVYVDEFLNVMMQLGLYEE